MRDLLRQALSVAEVEGDRRLRMVLVGLLLFYYVTFYNWWKGAASVLSTKGTESFNFVPMWALENWRCLILLGHFETKIYLWLLGMLALLGIFWLIYSDDALPAMGILLFLFANKLFYYLSDLRLMANFHHLHLLYSFVFLISRSKLFFFRLALGVSYLLSAMIKFTPSWLYGEYFNSVPGKLPLLPKHPLFVKIAMWSVMALELFGPFLWLARQRWLRRLSLAAFLGFHLYSGVLVGYKYTTLMLTLVIPAFLDFDEPLGQGYRFQRRDLLPFGFLGLALFGGLFHFLIPGDVRLTAEGRYLGVFMFDANRTIVFHATISKGNKTYSAWVKRPWRNGAILEDGALETDTSYEVWGSVTEGATEKRERKLTRPLRDGDQIIFNPAYFTTAQVRTFGDPYLYYFYGRELMRRYHPDKLSLELYQQLDGHSEAFKVLDIEDFGALDPHYTPFAHNSWISLPGPDSEATYRWW